MMPGKPQEKTVRPTKFGYISLSSAIYEVEKGASNHHSWLKGASNR